MSKINIEKIGDKLFVTYKVTNMDIFRLSEIGSVRADSDTFKLHIHKLDGSMYEYPLDRKQDLRDVYKILVEYLKDV
jgi:hypothetical protein